MSQSVSALERPIHRFISLKPRLLKCTTAAMDNMGTTQKNDLPLEVLTLPRVDNANHGEDIVS
jgi:hypothetical protein